MFIRTYKYLKKITMNKICPVKYAKMIGVSVGNDCRFIDVNFGSEPYLITIGNHVSLTCTKFLNHDGAVWVFRSEYPDIDYAAPIKIGNNVYMGYDVTILPGVSIGDNVVIGTRSVITKDIPSNCVVAGIPARPIRSLDEYKEKILKYSMQTKQMSAKQKKEYFLKKFNNFYQKRYLIR